MSFRHLLRLGVAVIFAAVCLGLSVPLAFAADGAPVKDCDQQVLDLTAKHVLTDDGSIQKAIEALTSQGVDVRVRAFDNTPGGSFDAYEDSQIKECVSWGSNGHIKPNLLVVLDGLDHQDAIYFGLNFGERMQSEVDNIRGAMRSPNQQGQFATAVATALTDSSEVIKGNQDPATMWGGLSAVAWFGIIMGAIIFLAIVFSILWWRSGGGGGGGSTFFYGGGSYGGGHHGGGSYGGGSDGGGSSGNW